MAIDYGKDSGLAYPKTRVRALERADKAKAIEAQDRKENAKARKRAKGRCEVIESTGARYYVMACSRKDTQTHHLISGIGRRNKGKSILAAHKLRVCDQCHHDLHAKILQPTTSTDEAASVRYRRAR
jgi:hypothetical protein